MGDIGVIDREGEDIGGIQDLEVRGEDFDLTGGDPRVVGPLGTRADPARDANDRFAVEAGGAVEEFDGHVRGVKDGLGAAFSIADIEKEDTAEVASGMDPAFEANHLSGMAGSEFITMMGSLHAKDGNLERQGAGNPM
jgi:hypothetical protein